MQMYRSYSQYLKDRFGERVHKVSLDAGFTCPNRDGTKAVGGCIYCNNESFNFSPSVSISEQLASGIEKAKRRFGARNFIAYFQAYTNTYAEPGILYDLYSTIYDFPEVVGLSIGTRPDCVPDDVLEVIARFAATHEVWLEIGLESSDDQSLHKINRAHTFHDFHDAVVRAHSAGLRVATHIITGFPWETTGQMLQTGRDVASLPVEAIKIHNLHIVKGTALERMHSRAPFELLSMEEYCRIAAQILELLPPEMVVMRLSAECPKDLLIAPSWCNNKAQIRETILQHLKDRDSYQGKRFSQEALKLKPQNIEQGITNHSAASLRSAATKIFYL